ncbi:MAG: hypothetical protein OXI19_11375 [Gemmatimonadota bacterium]|nr:hypothetical protein [Gemmatimonadota bacterium]
MQFSVEWISDGPNRNLEERKTLCDLRIDVNGKVVSANVDSRTKDSHDALTMPAVHLAEGIAVNWWTIFGSRDVAHSLLPWRMGHALPDIRFECQGSGFIFYTKPLQYENPPLVFWQSAEEFVATQSAEHEFKKILCSVVERLDDAGVFDSEVQIAWRRVLDTLQDSEETKFCRAAGALGVDPYAISEEDAMFVEEAGKLFSGETLIEFLADVRVREAKSNSIDRLSLLEWMREWRPKYDSALPRLGEVAVEVRQTLDDVSNRPPWVIGYLAARAFRDAVGLQNRAPLSISRMAQKLGTTNFRRASGPEALYAVVAREERQVHIHLRSLGAKTWQRNAETFSFARAIGDAVCFSDAGLSTINGLHRATRQAVGRAFAAEVLAPKDTVLEMRQEDREVEEIAALLEVNSKTVEHQIENTPEQNKSVGWALGAAN